MLGSPGSEVVAQATLHLSVCLSQPSFLLLHKGDPHTNPMSEWNGPPHQQDASTLGEGMVGNHPALSIFS